MVTKLVLFGGTITIGINQIEILSLMENGLSLEDAIYELLPDDLKDGIWSDLGTVESIENEEVEPDFEGFLLEFLTPGNPLYLQLEGGVKYASFSCQQHWINMRIGITNPYIRSPLWLLATWNQLIYCLEGSLPTELKASIETLFANYNLLEGQL
ncbi:MAG: hypothetical protein ACRCUS_10545 [Anaerovoracaceae bacterium]